MKNPILKRVMGIALAVATVFTSVPVVAVAEESSAALTPADEFSAMTDSEITDMFSMMELEEAAAILNSLSEDEFNNLIKRDTWLTQTTTVTDYVSNEVADEAINFAFEKEYECKYYEYVLASVASESVETDTTDSKFAQEKYSTFKNKSGYFYIYGKKDGVAAQSITVTISGVDITKDVMNQQTVHYSFASTGSNPYGNITLPAAADTKLYRLNHDKANACSILELTISAAPAANCSVETALANCKVEKGFSCTYQSGTSYLLCTNIAANSTVGSSGSTGMAGQYIFNFISGNYTIAFNNGSDATHASGSMSNMSLKPDATANLNTNMFKNNFIVNYDLNLQETDLDKDTLVKEPDYVERAFTGWKCSNGKTYSSGAAVSGLGTPGQTVTMTAMWNSSANFVLPNIERNGYILTGWTDEADSENPVTYDVGKPITLTSDKTLKANWESHDVEVTVNHYIQKKIAGDFELFSTEIVSVIEGIDHTFALNENAIKAVDAIDKCKCKRPTVVTRATTELDNTPINYYYYCEPDPSSIVIPGITPGSNNPGGLSDADIEKIISAIKNSNTATFTIDGVTYTIVRKSDGTFVIQFAETQKDNIVVSNYYKFGDYIVNITELADGAFKNNSSIKNVVISNGMTTIGNYAFYNCKNLESIVIPNTVLKIGKYAFANCPKLKKVTMSKNVYEWGTGIFSNDTVLPKISLGTKLTKVPKNAFKGCKKLKSITLPGTTTQIGSNAFNGCKSLKTMKIKSKVLRKVGSNAFKGCRKNLKIKVPKGKGNEYAKKLQNKGIHFNF